MSDSNNNTISRVVGVKKSEFIGDSTIPDNATLDYVNPGSNIKITFSDLKTELGVTGSLTTAGDSLGAPVLSGVAPNYLIRNMESGFGTTASISAQDGVQIDAVIDSGTGDASLVDSTGGNPLIRALDGMGGIAVSQSGDSVLIDGGTLGLASRVIVRSAADLSGTLDSTKEYFVDGAIDMGTTSIEVPVGGLTITGLGRNISSLFSTQDNYTMFTSPAGGGGSLLIDELQIGVSGANSQVFNLVSVGGNVSISSRSVTYANCTSRGEIDSYLQGSESSVAIVGGTPTLTLSGSWNGYTLDGHIVGQLDAGMTEPLYKAGTAFTMASRFRSNSNANLPASAAFFDFADTNFPNPSTIQLTASLITRNGVSDPTDANITPNVTAGNLSCSWIGNQGIENTHVGGRMDITAETATTINTPGVFELIEGTFTASDLQHFDSPSNGQLRHLGNSPRAYNARADFIIDGDSGDDILIRLRKFDSSLATTTTVATQERVINNFTGGNDLAFFSLFATVELDQNDYIFFEIANNTDISDVTALNDSFAVVAAR